MPGLASLPCIMGSLHAFLVYGVPSHTLTVSSSQAPPAHLSGGSRILTIVFLPPQRLEQELTTSQGSRSARAGLRPSWPRRHYCHRPPALQSCTASSGPTRPTARALPSPSPRKPCTYSACAQSQKPGPEMAWSLWQRSRAVALCRAAAPQTAQPTCVSTPTRGAGAGVGTELRGPSGPTGPPPMRRTVQRLSAGQRPSCVSSAECLCPGTRVRWRARAT